MSSANRFLMLLNVMFFIVIIGVVIYFQTADFRAEEVRAYNQIEGL